MTLALKKGNELHATDFEELVKTLTPAQKAFLVTTIRHAAEHDYSVVEEFYMYLANDWMDNFSESDKTRAQNEAAERFFTLKAHERYQREFDDAEKAGSESGLILPEGTDDGRTH